MALIITGTVLLLAVSISLPFLNVKLLGLIMIFAGLVKAAVLQRAPIKLSAVGSQSPLSSLPITKSMVSATLSTR